MVTLSLAPGTSPVDQLAGVLHWSLTDPFQTAEAAWASEAQKTKADNPKNTADFLSICDPC
jgi:hypothetical protein